MNTLPLILFSIFLLGICYMSYSLYKSKKERNSSYVNDTLWKKARWGLFIFMPFLAVFEVLSDDLAGNDPRIIATIVNFFISKYIFNKIAERDIEIKFPKLTVILISVLVFVIQISFGILISKYI